MLFNSYIFIFAFLPVTLTVYYLIGKMGHFRVAISWLVATSLIFYGYWNPAYLGLIIISIIGNYAFGLAINSHNRSGYKKTILITGVALNLAVLGYFKYANFFIDNINLLFETSFNLEKIILPLAISFFTFQQITYLVDSYRGETREYNFLHYTLFVSFFPQLIAGPIVHHKEMLPQFLHNNLYRLNWQNLSVGLTFFIIGLFKKVGIADELSVYASPLFRAADDGVTLTFFESWVAALSYTFQLYFDFSGYSDMAIGVARMFGIVLPLNFFSPYKAKNIIEFWRRWHITLSRFLRDYIYIPLGGNRKGQTRRQLNLIITMLLGGLWHGAGWNFIIWGALHGIYLSINHAWQLLTCDRKIIKSSYLTRGVSWSITFLAVVFGWVFFRAETLDGALSMISSMLFFNGLSIPYFFESLTPTALKETVTFHDNFLLSESYKKAIPFIVAAALISFYLPNLKQMLNHENVTCDPGNQFDELNKKPRFKWTPSLATALALFILFYYSLAKMSCVSEFLYFNF